MPMRCRILKRWAKLAIAVIYRRVDVVAATERVPSGPAILAVNHTNALADPVVILAKTSGFPRFLAAASWWEFAPARWLFRLAGVLPVHRREEEGDTEQNLSMFAACHETLALGAQIAIHPEGEMHQGPALLPLRTGAARIALGAVMDHGVCDVVVVPHAVVYADRGRWRSQAALNVGAPIEVADWADDYRADPEAAVRGLTERIADGMRTVTGTYDTVRGAQVIDRAAASAVADLPDADDRGFGRRNELARSVGAAINALGGESSAAFRALDSAVAAEADDLRRLGVRRPDVRPRFVAESASERRRNLLGLAVLTPLATLGLITNAPVVMGAAGACRSVSGEGWRATTVGVVGSGLCPVAWGIETVLAYRARGLRCAVAVAVLGPIGGWAGLTWSARWVRWRHEAWRDRVATTEPDAFTAARTSRDRVRRVIDEILTATPPAA